MNLEQIIQPHELDHSQHDELIKTVSINVELTYHALKIAWNAYYKIPDKSYPGGFVESDIDLLMANYDHQEYGVISNYKQLSPEDIVLWAFEMKTHDTASQYKKAQRQLKRHKDVLTRYTPYQNIKGFYCFWNGKQDVIRVEEI